jgi:hypothetical protein
MNQRSVLKIALCLIFFSPLFFYLRNPKISQSAPSTELKDQLSSAQLSYFAHLGAGNTAGNSIIYINSTGTTLSTNNYNLDIGDTLLIQNSVSGTNTYIVKGLVDGNAISIDSGIGVSNVASGLSVISPRYAIHTISFKPQSSITAGKWQVLIKANGTLQADNNPDTAGFDQGTLLNAAVTCPWSATAGDVGTTAVVSGNSYHIITCSLPAGGTNPIGTSGTVIIGNATNMLMNPAPAANHTIGQANASADTYTFILRHLDSSGATVDEDTTSGKIAVTESVRVTATVDPTITFSVGNSGVTTSTARCGTALGAGAANTTGASVEFGSLNLSAFNNLAQFLQCTTNATNGYVIQTFESGRLTMIGSNTTIPDTTCPSNSCTTSSAALWTTSSTSGFGYALEVGTTSAGAVLGITTTSAYKPFGVGYANAQPVLSRTNTPSGTDSAYICYRITVSNTQPAGTYQNEINFIATATF